MKPLSPKNASDPNAIFEEINKIGRDLDNAERMINGMDRLRAEVTAEVDANKAARSIGESSEKIKAALTSIIQSMKALKTTPGAAGAPKRQIDTKQNKLSDLQAKYRQKEMELNHAVRDQMRAQLRITNPALDEYEIAEAVPDSQPQQIFQQAIMQSGRRGEATKTLGAVQQRHEQIKKLEQDIIELASQFTELEALVCEQEPLVEKIDQQAEQAEQDIVQANVHLGKAEVKARSARKKKWWCLGIGGKFIPLSTFETSVC